VGIIGAILGVLGILLAFAEIIAAWTLNPPVTRGLIDFTGALNQGLAVTEAALQRSAEYIDSVRTELANGDGDLQPTVERVAGSVDALQATLEGATNTVETMQQVAGATNRIPLVGNNQPQQETAGALDRVAVALDRANQAVANLEQRAAEVASAGAEAVAGLNQELDVIEAEIASLQTTVDEAQAQVTAVQERIPFWVDLGSITATLLFVWYGIAQLCLLILSWRWVRNP
jgi:methyl-accepting chemotaxis protein